MDDVERMLSALHRASSSLDVKLTSWHESVHQSLEDGDQESWPDDLPLPDFNSLRSVTSFEARPIKSELAIATKRSARSLMLPEPMPEVQEVQEVLEAPEVSASREPAPRASGTRRRRAR